MGVRVEAVGEGRKVRAKAGTVFSSQSPTEGHRSSQQPM